MRTRDDGNFWRPAFVGLLGGATVVAAVVVWMATRPVPVVKASFGSVVRKWRTTEKNEPGTPTTWQRTTPSPRGAAVSVRAAAREPSCPPPASATAKDLENCWGIRVNGARLSMGNAFLDLRYEVVDPRKASLLADGKTRAYILDHASGARLPMPSPPKEGAFPPTGNRLATNRTYFAMVGNRHGVLKSGNKVSVVVGDSTTTKVTID